MNMSHPTIKNSLFSFVSPPSFLSPPFLSPPFMAEWLAEATAQLSLAEAVAELFESSSEPSGDTADTFESSEHELQLFGMMLHRSNMLGQFQYIDWVREFGRLSDRVTEYHAPYKSMFLSIC